jgi:hypothetical protein
MKSQTVHFAYLDDFERTLSDTTKRVEGNRQSARGPLPGCSTFLEVVVKYDLRIFVAERIAQTPLTADEMEHCVKATFRYENLWEGNNGRSLGPDGLPEMLTVLLTQRHKLEFRDELQEAVLKRLYNLKFMALVSVLKGLYKHCLIDLTAIGDPDEALHQQVRMNLTWKEYLDLWEFLRREKKLRQPLPSTPTINLPRAETRQPLQSTPTIDRPEPETTAIGRTKRRSVGARMKGLARGLVT